MSVYFHSDFSLVCFYFFRTSIIFFLVSLVLTTSPNLDPSADVINMLFTPSLTGQHYHLSVSLVMIVRFRVREPSEVLVLISELQSMSLERLWIVQWHTKGLGIRFTWWLNLASSQHSIIPNLVIFKNQKEHRDMSHQDNTGMMSWQPQWVLFIDVPQAFKENSEKDHSGWWLLVTIWSLKCVHAEVGKEWHELGPS